MLQLHCDFFSALFFYIKNMKDWKTLLMNKPISSSKKADIDNWKKEIRILREKEEREYQNNMKDLEDQWDKTDWENFKIFLNKLSLDEIIFIANNIGIEFVGGNKNVSDTKNMSAKEQFISVFDEVPRGLVMRYYNDVVNGQIEIIKSKNIKELFLLNAIIEINGLEYLIDKNALESIKSEDKTVLLKRIVDHNYDLISYKEVERNIRSNGIIDYLF